MPSREPDVPPGPEAVARRIHAIRRRVREDQDGRATATDLAEVAAALAAQPASADLWTLRGDLIQLAAEDAAPGLTLDDALASYRRAAELAPDRPEAWLEIGHFLDAVRDDPAAARPHLERAVRLGGGEPARSALEAVRAQLDR